MPEDNGYDDFLAAIELLPDESDWLGPQTWQILKEGIGSFAEAELQGFFLVYQPALDKLREALSKPFVVPYQWLFQPNPWAALFPELPKARQFARILSVQAAYQQRRDEHQQALDSLQQALILGENLSRGGVLIDRLVSIAIEAIGLEAWKEWIGRKPSADTLRQASEFLGQFEQQQVPFWKTIVMQGWCGRQTLEDLYANRIPPYELEAWKEEWPEMGDLLNINKDEVIKEAERYSMKLVAIARMPLSKAIEQQEPELDIAPLKPLVPLWLDRMLLKVGGISAQLRGVQIMVALEHYRSEQPHQGRYPPQLSDLVPGYLAELPKDPFTDEDFIYRRENNLAYRLYSVGRNRVDDGGVHKGKYWLRDDPDIVIADVE